MASPDTFLVPLEGGLQELSGHFENQKVMYGFCSVKDSQAALPKYVLINWVCSCGMGLGAEGPRVVGHIPPVVAARENPTLVRNIAWACRILGLQAVAFLLPCPEHLFAGYVVGW